MMPRDKEQPYDKLGGRRLSDILSVMELAALRAAEEILAVYRGSEVTAQTKADGSPLTEADLRSQKVIVDCLSASLPFPIFAEESVFDGSGLGGSGLGGSGLGGPASGSSPFFLVDPVDGTKDFLARNDEFTVNIALVIDDAPVLGVIGVPALQLLYAGGGGLGVARLDCASGVRTVLQRSAPPAEGQPLRQLASRFHDSPEVGRFASLLGQAQLIRAGSALKFCRLTEGAADLYFRSGPTCEWDTAAGHCLVREHEFRLVALPGGEELRYGKQSLLNPGFLVARAEEIEHFLDLARQALLPEG